MKTHANVAKDTFQTSEIQLGKYEHYKGNFYEVVGVVLHTETNEKLVLYKALYELDKNSNGEPPLELFARPYNMFFEKVLIDGNTVDRFKYVGTTNGQKDGGRVRVA